MQSKYLTASGLVLAEPFYFIGCHIIRNAQNVVADVKAHSGTTVAGPVFWRYIVGVDDARTLRIMRDSDDHLLVEGGVYAELSPDTELIVFYRPIQPL